MSTCEHCEEARFGKMLREVIALLEDGCHRLDMELIEHGDEPGAVDIGLRVQRMLDEAQQRMDDARRLEIWHKHLENYPETMGNIFPSNPRKYD